MPSGFDPHMDMSRQELFIGADAQKQLAGATVGIVGCGALGSHMAGLLCRAGVGSFVLVDRDYVEESNLQRQDYVAADVSRMKAEVCAARLRAINAEVEVSFHVIHLSGANVSVLDSCDVVLDGTDNFSTRFVLDEYCQREGKSFVHASVVGAQGYVGCGVCLSCVYSEVGVVGTCDTDGVLATAPAFIASVASTVALRVLQGEDVAGLWHYDLFGMGVRSLTVAQREGCLSCAGSYVHLDAVEDTVHLCGKGAYQFVGGPFDLEALHKKLGGRLTPYCLFVDSLSIFPNRVFVKAETEEKARSVYAQYLS